MSDLKKLREGIDELDDEIIELLDRRFELSMRVKEYKQNNSVNVLDTKREDEIKEKVLNYPSKLKSNEQILEVYNSILKCSKDLQK